MSELSIAVRDALREEGLSLMNEPMRFSELVLSKIDSGSREAKVIRAACDEGYLSIFVALGSQPNNESLSEAVAKAAKYLDEEHVINFSDAWNVSRSIAEGLGSFLGVTTQIASSPNTDGAKATKHRGPRKGGPLTTVMISAVVFLALSIAGGLVAWHFIPFNGCTLLPRKSPIGAYNALERA